MSQTRKGLNAVRNTVSGVLIIMALSLSTSIEDVLRQRVLELAYRALKQSLTSINCRWLTKWSIGNMLPRSPSMILPSLHRLRASEAWNMQALRYRTLIKQTHQASTREAPLGRSESGCVQTTRALHSSTTGATSGLTSA